MTQVEYPAVAPLCAFVHVDDLVLGLNAIRMSNMSRTCVHSEYYLSTGRPKDVQRHRKYRLAYHIDYLEQHVNSIGPECDSTLSSLHALLYVIHRQLFHDVIIEEPHGIPIIHCCNHAVATCPFAEIAQHVHHQERNPLYFLTHRPPLHVQLAPTLDSETCPKG